MNRKDESNNFNRRKSRQSRKSNLLLIYYPRLELMAQIQAMRTLSRQS